MILNEKNSSFSLTYGEFLHAITRILQGKGIGLQFNQCFQSTSKYY